MAVQLDQVLTTLQSDVRTDLQILLDQFGNALDKHGGSEGLRELFRSSPGAFRYTSQVNEALLGQQPHDLSDLIVNLDSTVEALGPQRGRAPGPGDEPADRARARSRPRAPPSSRASPSCRACSSEGEPALVSLNEAFPAVRAFAREALPGVRSTPATLDAATPFLRQLRGLVSRDELRGLTADLRPAIPDLARLSRRTIPLLNQFRSLSSCLNEVAIPWSNDDGARPRDADAHRPRRSVERSRKVFEELTFGITGISSESRSGDANGPYIKVLAAGGPNTVVFPDPLQDDAGRASRRCRSSARCRRSTPRRRPRSARRRLRDAGAAEPRTREDGGRRPSRPARRDRAADRDAGGQLRRSPTYRRRSTAP